MVVVAMHPIVDVAKRKTRREPNGEVLLSKDQVSALIGVGHTRIWEWTRDDLFPKPIELGPPGGRSTMIAWYRSEVEQWIASRPRRQFGQHAFRGKRADEPVTRDTDNGPVTRGAVSAVGNIKNYLARPQKRRAGQPTPSTNSDAGHPRVRIKRRVAALSRKPLV